jgi:hypothetical protein
MSVDYYVRLEQARSPQPSTQMLMALSRALRLSDDERDHIFYLAGHEAPSRLSTSGMVRLGLLPILDQLTESAAHVVSDLGIGLQDLSRAEPGDLAFGEFPRFSRRQPGGDQPEPASGTGRF